MRRTKASIIHQQTGNLRAVQILLGHAKIESAIRYLGFDEALSVSVEEHRVTIALAGLRCWRTFTKSGDEPLGGRVE